MGVYISPQAPGGKPLDNPDLYPLYDAAQPLDWPLLAHRGTARPPLLSKADLAARCHDDIAAGRA